MRNAALLCAKLPSRRRLCREAGGGHLHCGRLHSQGQAWPACVAVACPASRDSPKEHRPCKPAVTRGAPPRRGKARVSAARRGQCQQWTGRALSVADSCRVSAAEHLNPPLFGVPLCVPCGRRGRPTLEAEGGDSVFSSPPNSTEDMKPRLRGPPSSPDTRNTRRG